MAEVRARLRDQMRNAKESGLSHCSKALLSRPKKTVEDIGSPKEKVGDGVMEEETRGGSCSPRRVTTTARDVTQVQKGAGKKYSNPLSAHLEARGQRSPGIIGHKRASILGLKPGKRGLRRDFRRRAKGEEQSSTCHTWHKQSPSFF